MYNMKKLFDLTYPQKSILLTEQFFKNMPVNNICGTAIINEEINFDNLKKAINFVIKNNDKVTLYFKNTGFSDMFTVIASGTASIVEKDDMVFVDVKVDDISGRYFN